MSKSEFAIHISKDMLEFDPNTGYLTWKGEPHKDKTQIGNRAGYLGKDGYRYVMVKNVKLLEHRVAWLITYGVVPDQIDHINMVRDDNRIANLREASVSQNNRNRTKQSNNTSGFKGVTYHKGTGKFAAKITFNKKCYSLGYFASAESAHKAYIKASGELHGEFARH